MTALYVISVRQVSVLPSASFRSHLTVDTLAVQLVVPLTGSTEGLSPPSHPTTTTRIGTAPVKALRAMPGAQKKRGLSPVVLSNQH
jgi:hypothetical protein